MAKSFTLYKLIILYMLNEVDFPLTNSQISEFILDEDIQPTLNYSRLYPNFWNQDLFVKNLLITVHFIILRKTEQRPSIILQTISLLQSSMISTNF